MVGLELKFLQEIGRVVLGPEAILLHLEEQFDLQVCLLPLERVSQTACFKTWTCDALIGLLLPTQNAPEMGSLRPHRLVAKPSGAPSLRRVAFL